MKYWKRIKTRLVEPEGSKKDEDVRSRLSGFSAGEGPDIASLWEEQTLADRDKKLHSSRAKKSSKKVLKNTGLSNEKLKYLKKNAAKTAKKAGDSVRKKAQKKDLYQTVKTRLRRKQYAIPLIILLAGIGIYINGSSSKPSQQTLGDANSKSYTSDQLPRERAAFTLLYPKGKTEKDYEIVRVSPEGSAPAYTYLDKIGSVNINVSQQELPERFKENREPELEKLAKDFQATNIIKIDESTVYHGLNEQANVQSIIFIKNDILFLVRAQQSVSDDEIAGYILNLN